MGHAKVMNFDFTGNVNAGLSKDSHQHASNIQAQILRVLMCTARLLANSPGGLRFKAGTRPWLILLTNERTSY
jgi:hypothetical protein